MNLDHLLRRLTPTLALAAALASPGAWAQSVSASDAWARATIKGQKTSGAYLKLTASQASRLVGAASPVAGAVEIHQMTMEGDVMKMSAVEGGLELPAGKAVELKPGGYHLMLLDLKVVLPKDGTIPLTLVFKDAKGAETRSEVTARVLTTPPAGGHGDHGGHSGHKH